VDNIIGEGRRMTCKSRDTQDLEHRGFTCCDGLKPSLANGVKEAVWEQGCRKPRAPRVDLSFALRIVSLIHLISLLMFAAMPRVKAQSAHQTVPSTGQCCQFLGRNTVSLSLATSSGRQERRPLVLQAACHWHEEISLHP
jgi:hypothetical protein